ncbi:MAG: sigma-70 family RNA polymerase sigma factor [Bacteroidales bacterium]|nr:sigma-70 family RNA polymerase sigma factor [Bacteroidales bacterium]
MDNSLNEPHVRFRSLWRRHEKQVRRYCLRAAHGNVDRACEFVQEVALRLILNCDKLVGDETTERAWVMRVMQSAVGNARRTLNPHFDLVDDQSLLDIPDRQETSELRETLDDLMTILDDDERQLLNLYLKGFDINDLATIYSLSYSAVGTRLSRLRQKLTLRARQLNYIR